jgi:hypothetical protein
MQWRSTFRLSIVLSVILVVVIGTVAWADTDPALQGKLLARSDGVYFVYQDGYKKPIALADIGDDAINAIPDGPPPPAAAPASPAAAPAPKPGDVLYQADWSQGMNGWAGSANWGVASGMLVSQGGDATAWAPFQAPTPDYAVEAELQNLSDQFTFVMGVTLRGSMDGISYYTGGVVNSEAAIVDGRPFGGFRFATKQFTVRSKEWHAYRLEAKGNHLKLFVDGSLVLESDDNRHLTGTGVGIAGNGQVIARNFKVIQL